MLKLTIRLHSRFTTKQKTKPHLQFLSLWTITKKKQNMSNATSWEKDIIAWKLILGGEEKERKGFKYFKNSIKTLLTMYIIKWEN